MRRIKSVLIFYGLFLVSVFAYSETQFHLFGKGNFLSASGTASDYVEGENDFPITASHQNYGIGFGLTFGQAIFIGFEGHYNFSGKATQTDPSDGDTVEIDTYKYALGLVTLGFSVVRNRLMKIYLNGGGGFCRYLDTETKSYVSRLGYETIVEPPDPRKKSFPAGFGGFGLDLYLSQSSGIMLGVRYLYIATPDEPQIIYTALAGFIFRF